MFFNRVKVRKNIRFYGWVQAVGFRYRASVAADKFGVTGWVKNEYDGSVSMEIQGTEEEIDKVVEAIQKGSYIRIERMEVKTLDIVPEERGFHVRYI